MSDDQRKNKQCTGNGNVPKGKHRNNSRSSNELKRSRTMANNSADYWQHSSDRTNPAIINTRRNQGNNYYMMNTSAESSYQPSNNGCLSFNLNGSTSAETSSSVSRRSSSGSTLKCDNITKFPDKKQIEDKLHQIREYLKISNSLMATMKHSDDQNNIIEKENLEKMTRDLRDSEKKLCGVLDLINTEEVNENDGSQVVENGVDNTSEHSASSNIKNEIDTRFDSCRQDIDFMRNQQHEFLQLQQKAENKLRNARQMQSNLLSLQACNDVNVPGTSKECKSLPDFDAAIKELEERAIKLGPAHIVSNQQLQENIQAKVESLHNQILSMHNANDEREQLIQVLDNRDAEFRSHHIELQNKLLELQNKKSQVDQLVSQLQGYANEDEEDDVGGQVRNIVTMKDQLKKLKDMLEIVKRTENIMENTNSTNASSTAQAVAFQTCSIVENFLEKDNQKHKLRPIIQNDNNMLRYDNDTSNENRSKQVNQTRIEQVDSRAVKSRIASVSEKFALQSELELKKKELEDLMGKHKASTSNLNHDGGVDIKSDYSCASHTLNEAWIPLISHQNDTDRYSSSEEEGDINEYTELPESHNLLPLPNVNYSATNSAKPRSDNANRIEYVRPMEWQAARGNSKPSDRNLDGQAVIAEEHTRSNSEQNNISQVQKQLQLIKSVCDSMLEQHLNQPSSNVNVQQLRNNLTPSPFFSEPTLYSSPHPSASNVVNPIAEAWLPPNPNLQNNQNIGSSHYQSWLAANATQTQSIMLNTLNQCCQMLWLQQRELVSLRNAVNMMQVRQDNSQYQTESVTPSAQQHYPPQLDQQRSPNQYRPSIPSQKTNHVSAAFSMPNLNQYNCPNNIDPQYMNMNNIQPARLLDHSCLNNTLINHQQDHANNSVLHGVNINNHHPLPNHMWNGQALNNQVPPGNRANNYWDNFRSYSRQNLLSTKNNEVLHTPSTSTMERSNIINERTNPFSLMSFSKCNSEQDSASTSQENTPQRRVFYRHENVNTVGIPQSDVVNVNHSVGKSNEQLNMTSTSQNHSDVANLNFQMMNLNRCTDNSSNVSEDRFCIQDQGIGQNEWSDELTEGQTTKSKLFDELRENVYKEVASLISANEARPHFLIQLFRDLQMIGSDSLRLKILQSIQMVVTHSQASSHNPIKHSMESQQSESSVEVPQPSEQFSLQSTVWSKPMKNAPNCFKSLDYVEHHNFIKDILPFLNDHEDETIQSSLILSLKEILLESGILKEAVKDSIFVKYFANLLDEVLEQFRGKKVRDVKIDLHHTLHELLSGELGFILFIQENDPENPISHLNSEVNQENSNFSTGTSSFEPQIGPSISQQAPDMQNGDLAEADQSRTMNDDIEEETAGSNILEISIDMNEIIPNACGNIDIPLDYASNVQGLDRVPTRLRTKAKSRSTTPKNDSSSSREPDSC